ncbi:DinB family protein [Halalkalibacterium halodurans]|uniref:Damage-inducible protein DinB n=1 Tax=Halalkalibacterium halodurans TaxID=86665 RepID=A0A0M0KF88_ALKHA|nr:DinB family protein [Halalkalibacterium halodurans]TPE66868.1 DinB family protein [Halalkalibacterium halodurans]
MDTNGVVYAAKMTNALAKEIPESKWEIQLVPELGTLRKLFIHIVRVRDVYRDGLKTGSIKFPGQLASDELRLLDELERSMEELVFAFKQTTFDSIKMGENYLSIMELLGTVIQHEGIHQGQYYVALKQSGMNLPKQWVQDWHM